MIPAKSHSHRPDPLLLLAAAVLLCALMTSAATAGEASKFPPGLAVVQRPQLQDNGLTLASVGHEGGGVSVSLTPPHPVSHDSAREPASAVQPQTLSEVFVYLRYPW